MREASRDFDAGFGRDIPLATITGFNSEQSLRRVDEFRQRSINTSSGAQLGSTTIGVATQFNFWLNIVQSTLNNNRAIIVRDPRVDPSDAP